MDLFADMVGFAIIFGAIATFWIYTKDAMDTYKEEKREERIDTVKKHPVLASIVSALVAWKAFDIWNKSRQASQNGNGKANAGNRGTSASGSEGRSVYEDLNLD